MDPRVIGIVMHPDEVLTWTSPTVHGDFDGVWWWCGGGKEIISSLVLSLGLSAVKD